MSNIDRMMLLVRSVFQERYFSGNAIAKNLSIVAEHKIKSVKKTPHLPHMEKSYMKYCSTRAYLENLFFSPNFHQRDVNTMPIKRIESVIEMHFKWLPMEEEKAWLFWKIIKDMELKKNIPMGIKVIKPYKWIRETTLSSMDFVAFPSSVVISSLMCCPRAVVVSLMFSVKFFITSATVCSLSTMTMAKSTQRSVRRKAGIVIKTMLDGENSVLSC